LGFYLTIVIDKGKQVDKGQALFQLSPGELASEESKARGNLDMAIAEAKTVVMDVQTRLKGKDNPANQYAL